jgi:Tfp pilus assembly protein PilX
VKQSNQQGIVLVTTLLFLTIISLLAMDIIETHLLETKMSSYYYAKAKAFYLAQQDLRAALANLSNQNSNVHYSGTVDIKKSRSADSQIIYTINVKTKYHKAISCIESAYFKDKKQKLQLLWWKQLIMDVLPRKRLSPSFCSC